ncbi:AAA family ATPase [Plectonema cf. radiosum LEGE 06105]|uniref:histidine kinase n=1 Tax=Plectonema cf. radiosum LEGE 06105 TaxID=945769 RepID=A0A8J7K2U9_9CYAN|nr:AAA family ATPase [Plectonema radiosum]MBE9214747.1 AAA family ATPase [Plectonema cf. radiosum LEGE 06105]
MISITGYSIKEELYNGSRTSVYRAVREDDQKPVVIKLLKNPYPNFSELLQFRNQYTISKNLNSPLIIQIYSLDNYQNSYILVIEDMGGISLREYFIKYTVSLEEFLKIAITLCDILDILYRHRIIHKDIKPANILINPTTKQVKLIDFSIASLLPRENQTLVSPNILEGTLAYISPEQTGRMNRGIDYRSDFYSLGVTFYELLTRELPFKSDDAMELVHYHIAKTPPLLGKGIEIPQVLSAIVVKLMAKNAEDRYQSASGIKHDLETCLKQLQETGKIEYFEIAQRDICDRFTIPEKLYGRETEVETLLAAFEKISKGNSELMLVSGCSGIGKTAIINEVHKPIVKQHGYFIKGKFDQFNRNIPFSAFVQAFRDLMRQLFSETDVQLSIWKHKILQALGENARVIIDVIPELERIIGQQAPAPELSGTAAQNRFNLLFQKFIKVFTTKEHPLVIFLDDLQWADLTSLNLMQLLINESESKYLLLIGAYRNNEVFAAHPLMLTLEEIRKTGAIINTIILKPLNEESLNQLVANTLSCSLEIAQPLTQLIYQKTKGNPFFSTQFLKSLHEDNLITFNFDKNSWGCNISEVKKLALTDDVVEFMSLQLQKFPEQTQNILKLAACIGNQFDLATLGIVCEKSEAESAADLWKALQEGLIIPQSEIYKFYLETRQEIEPASQIIDYRFLHDRVQQAAYSLIPNEQKPITHLNVGKSLLKNIPTPELSEKIFNIVNHLNIGQNLIINHSEKLQLAELNLLAAKKSKDSTAYSAALIYIKTGISLLSSDCWQNNYHLTLSFYNYAVEVAYLTGNFEQMQKWADIILKQAKTILDKANAYEIIIQTKIAQNQLIEAVKFGLNVLELFGVKIPESPTPVDVQKALAEINIYLQDKHISDLIALPLMKDVYPLAAMRLLSIVWFPIIAAAPTLVPPIVFSQVNLSIKYGNAPSSSFAYAAYGLILQGFFQDAQSSYEFGQLALNLLQELNALELTPKTLFMIAVSTKHGKEHLKTTIPLFREAYQSGIENGDLEYSSHAAINWFQYSYFTGEELNSLKQEMAAISDVLIQFKHTTTLNEYRTIQQVILNLLGESQQPYILIGKAYNENEILPQQLEANDRIGLHFVYIHKFILCYLFEEFEQAATNAREAQIYLDGIAGCFYAPLFYFYDSLLQLSLYSEISQEEKLQQVRNNQEKIQNLTDHAPMNFQHKYDLIEAEKHRILDEKIKAIELYEKAIAGAKANEYIQEEALANELAAKFYLDWDKQKIAATYMQEAYYCYAKWGAKAKTDDLEKRYPQLLAPILQAQKYSFQINETCIQPNQTIQISRSSSSISEALDFKSILKATQALSKEIQLEELISTLLQIVIENAGAQKAALVFLKDDILTLEAVATQELGVTHLSIPYETSNQLPNTVINYVKRSLKTIVLDNAIIQNDLLTDEYLIRQQPYSLLCAPILDRGKLIGLLYLENKLIKGAFTRERLEVTNLLCTQAAISLQNAQLYAQQQQKTYEIAQKEEEYRSIFESVNDGLNICDLETGKIVAVNPTICQMYGYSQEEWFHLTPPDFMHPDLVCHFSNYVEIMNAGQEFYIKTISKRKDGTYFDTEIKAVPFIYKGKLHGLMIVRDISEQQAALRENQKAQAAVTQKSQELEKALLELNQTQLQMVQNEKMATLGNLVAGVAHEVNNPIGFLKGSINNAKEYIKDLFAHIECYQQHYPTPTDAVLEHAEEIDLEFLIEDLPKLIDSMKVATERIKDISTSLRTFSRADTDEKVACNLHEGIDSTILILKYRLKANDKRPAIEVVKEYGTLPPIKCFLGQLNQVFMNIIANAIDAIDTASEGKTFAQLQTNPYKIAIKTELFTEKNTALISIKDNGLGMPESVRERIFDHLFTTKEVGKGTGLGLAIALSIIEETHNGKISCSSKLGEGTEFFIELPID